MKKNTIEVAIQTIETEAAAIQKLTAFVDASFARLAEEIYASDGRLVVSGIGKSAIVAQKIVATLNSTGTPAVFMHAADAIHGDLGMIQRADIVLIISKSGESPEIKLLVPLIQSFGNKVIGMTGSVQSFLAKNADYIMNTTVDAEACPNNLAPTSSSTAQIVMGDALAVCLMEMRGFSGKDFARFHPGGNLGKKLYLRVKDLYVGNEKPVVSTSAGLKEVIMSISKGRVGATAVCDEEMKVTGIITDGDIRRLLEEHDAGMPAVKAADIMTEHPLTGNSDLMAVQAFELLKQNDINQLLIVDDNNRYLGVVHLHDLIKEGIF